MAFADRIAEALTSQGFEPLIDRSEIYAFEDWWKRIEALIVRANAVVFMLSPDSAASEVCAKEIAFATSLALSPNPVRNRAMPREPFRVPRQENGRPSGEGQQAAVSVSCPSDNRVRVIPYQAIVAVALSLTCLFWSECQQLYLQIESIRWKWLTGSDSAEMVSAIIGGRSAARPMPQGMRRKWRASTPRMASTTARSCA